MPKAYRTTNGRQQFKPILGEDIEESNFDAGIGFCLACGELAEGVEPDARRYTCESCGEPKVYGLAELAMMHLIATSP